MKKVTLIISLIFIFFSLSACKKNQDDSFKIFMPDLVDDYGNMYEIYEHLQKETNIYFKPSTGNKISNESLDILIASKNYPDIIQIDEYVDLETLIKNGFVEPLDQLIKDYAPNIYKLINENETYKKRVTYKDGKIYNLMSFDSLCKNFNYSYYIREDWYNLYKESINDTSFNLNVDNINDMFNWWKNNITVKDINNQVTNTKPIMYASIDADQYLVNYSNIMGLLGTNYWFYSNNLTNNQVRFAPLDDTNNWLNTLSIINNWNQQGYLHHNQFNNDGNQIFKELVVDTLNAGIICTNSISTVIEINNLYVDKNLNTKYVPLLSPSNYLWSNNSDIKWECQGVFIASTSKYKVEAIKLLDYCFSASGQELFNYGIKDVHYESIDGRNILKEGVIPSADNKIRTYNNFPTIYNNYLDNKNYDFIESVIKKNKNSVKNTTISNIIDRFYKYESIKLLEESKQKILRNGLNTLYNDLINEYIYGVINNTKNITSDYLTFKDELTKINISQILDLQQEALNIKIKDYNLE